MLSREVQRLTAEKVVAFFSQHKAGLDEGAQTESRYIDEADYVEVVRRANAAEQRREEMRGQLDSLHDQLLARGKVVAKLQSECDTFKTERDIFKAETERLDKELKAIQRDYKIESLEKGRLQAANKTLRRDVKTLTATNESLQKALASRNSEVEELEALHEEATVEARQVKQELRVVYRQYFQPKLLSSLSKDHRDERRRSIAEESPKRKVVEEEEAVVSRRGGRLRLRRLDLEEEQGAEGGKPGESGNGAQGQIYGNIKQRLAKSAVKGLRKRSDSVPYRKRPMEETLGLVKEEPKATPIVPPPSNSPDPALNPISEDPPERSVSPIQSESSEASSSESSEEQGFADIPPIRSHHPSHVYPETGELPRDETQQSLASTHIPVRAQEEKTRKSSYSSSVTRGLESVLDQSKERLEAEHSQKETIDRTRESLATETLRDMPVSPMSPRENTPKTEKMPQISDISASRISQYQPIPRNRRSIAVLTDPVEMYVRPSESIGVQYNWEQPETVYEEDGSFKGPDGTKYYVWPVNPNQLYGLSGDVFYHTLQQIFSVSPKIPLNRAGQPHQPAYLLEGTHLASPSPPDSSPPRRPHDPQVCGRDCAHRRPPRRREERLFPVAKQTLRY